jgi:hypothetical protein
LNHDLRDILTSEQVLEASGSSALAADLIAAYKWGVEYRLGDIGAAFTHLIRAGGERRRLKDTLQIELAIEAPTNEVGLGQESGASNVTSAIAFLLKDGSDEACGILLESEFYGVRER